jgi:hypothetical protein
MPTKLVASALALLTFVLLVPPLFAGESSPAVKLAAAPNYPILTLAGRVYGKVTVRVTIVARSRGECRAAMEIRGRRCPGACGDAEIQLCNSAAEFKGAGQTQSRQNPRAISKASAILQDVSAGILGAQTTRCSG